METGEAPPRTPMIGRRADEPAEDPEAEILASARLRPPLEECGRAEEDGGEAAGQVAPAAAAAAPLRPDEPTFPR